MSAGSTVWHSLLEGFFMLWQTLWALVLGFGLSGAVQAFVSRARMHRLMGDHRPAAIARGSLLGIASSSCSYAASALAKTLVARGADLTTAMVFMVASTNLVVELGLVLWLLIGWQFAAAEFAGGAVMIVLLALVLPRAVPRRVEEDLRERLATEGAVEAPAVDESEPLRVRVRHASGWRAAAGYTIGDLTMLRREIVIGFVVAGFLAVGVPTGFWSAVFVHGHGWLTTVENAAVGPAVAVISFVCSIGNVPLAAALWQHGVSFGGVVAFVFADLISLPLLLVYRKLYGAPLTWRLLAVFWPLMTVAGLVTEVLFRGLGGIPSRRPTVIAPEHFAWDHTTVLNLIALLAFAVLLRLHLSRPASAGGAHATDPVCGMQVERANPGATLRAEDTTYFFCSEHCRDRFAAGTTREAAGR